MAKSSKSGPAARQASRKPVTAPAQRKPRKPAQARTAAKPAERRPVAVEGAQTGPVAETPGARKHPWLQRWAERLSNSLAYAMAKRFIEIDLMAQAAALSLYALMSLAPLLLLVLWLTASLLPSAQEALLAQIAGLAGEGAREVAAVVIEHAGNRPNLASWTGLWNTLVLFVAATIVFAHLQATLNLVFAADAKPLGDGVLAWLRKRVFSMGIVFALGFLLLVSMVLTTVVQVAFSWLPALVPALANLVSLLLYALAFALLYRFLPDRPVGWKQALLGGGVTASLFVLGRWAIGLYMTHAAPGSAYGSFGTLVIMLVWIYYAALVFFVGALMTAVVDERLRRPPPSPRPQRAMQRR